MSVRKDRVHFKESWNSIWRDLLVHTVTLKYLSFVVSSLFCNPSEGKVILSHFILLI